MLPDIGHILSNGGCSAGCVWAVGCVACMPIRSVCPTYQFCACARIFAFFCFELDFLLCTPAPSPCPPSLCILRCFSFIPRQACTVLRHHKYVFFRRQNLTGSLHSLPFTDLGAFDFIDSCTNFMLRISKTAHICYLVSI